MATGVKPRDCDPELNRSDIETLETALKDKKFRDMLADYCDEIRDPENQALYQREMTQFEKERGVDITFVNPKPGYVIKTSVAGDRKAFINICSSDTAGKPSCSMKVVEGQRGLDWQIPYTLIPPREDYDRKKERCVLYDVVFHPDTLHLANKNKRFRELVNKTALDALRSTYKIELDQNNVRFPRSTYKGWAMPAVIRNANPDFNPEEIDKSGLSSDVMEKLYPQYCYPEPKSNVQKERFDIKQEKYTSKYTTPKYIIRQQKNVDFQDYTYEKNNKLHAAIPSQITVEVFLPLVCSSSDCKLDVKGKVFSVVCEKPAKYKLDLTLPYNVDDERGNAKFDKSKRALLVTLPVLKSHYVNDSNDSIQGLKLDSGVESAENSESTSDEDGPKEGLITEIEHTTPAIPADVLSNVEENNDTFLNPNLTYSLPSYTCNILDDTIAFTFHIKNCDPESVITERINCNTIRIKFISIGASYVPVYYAALLKFDEEIKFGDLHAEAWDNNVILQVESMESKPEHVFIGLDETNLTQVKLNTMVSTTHTEEIVRERITESLEQVSKPIIEVTNMMRETTVTVTSNDTGTDSSRDSTPQNQERVPIWKCYNNDSAAKSILRKPMNMSRSLSESSTGDVASSIDYISSDCIVEENSLKKTVRFNEVIARHRYRYNSSIEGQKKKNQRKKSKKRCLERRKSESEAEDEVFNRKVTEKKKDPSEKQRRDSGVADTSDGDQDDKNNENVKETKAKPPASISTTVKHKTDLYDPEKLNKGKYLEVNFKNDLIFDLDI